MNSFEEYMQDINFKSEHPELYDERKPKFKIGDVVVNIVEKYEKDSDIPYFVRKVILKYDGIHLSEHMYELGLVIMPDKIYVFNESDLEFQYHDKKWEEYVTESYRNRGLPPWKGELYNFSHLSDTDITMSKRKPEDVTLPIIYMKHIIDKHSLRKRIGVILDNKEFLSSIAKEMRCPVEKIDEFEKNIMTKIDVRNGIKSIEIIAKDRHGHRKIDFTDKESELISLVGYYDKYKRIEDSDDNTGESKDHYPAYMSDYDIMKSIKEAYGNAEKVEIEKSPKGLQSKKIICQGKSNKGLNIHFHYNLDLRIIETAYPVFVDTNNRPDLRHPENKTKKRQN